MALDETLLGSRGEAEQVQGFVGTAFDIAATQSEVACGYLRTCNACYGSGGRTFPD